MLLGMTENFCTGSDFPAPVLTSHSCHRLFIFLRVNSKKYWIVFFIFNIARNKQEIFGTERRLSPNKVKTKPKIYFIYFVRSKCIDIWRMANLKMDLDEYLLLQSDQKKSNFSLPKISTPTFRWFRRDPENSWLQEGSQQECCPKLVSRLSHISSNLWWDLCFFQTRIQRILGFLIFMGLGVFCMVSSDRITEIPDWTLIFWFVFRSSQQFTSLC